MQLALWRQQTGCGDIPVLSTLRIWGVAWRAAVGYMHAMHVCLSCVSLCLASRHGLRRLQTSHARSRLLQAWMFGWKDRQPVANCGCELETHLPTWWVCLCVIQ
jgi:hypothetical protein